jgi:hypothetical protein
LFVYCRGANTVYLLLYVDDILLIISRIELLQSTTTTLQREFAMKDLVPIHFLDI